MIIAQNGRVDSCGRIGNGHRAVEHEIPVEKRVRHDNRIAMNGSDYIRARREVLSQACRTSQKCAEEYAGQSKTKALFHVFPRFERARRIRPDISDWDLILYLLQKKYNFNTALTKTWRGCQK